MIRLSLIAVTFSVALVSAQEFHAFNKNIQHVLASAKTMACDTGQASALNTYAVDPSGSAVAIYGANTLSPNWSNSAGSVTQQTNWTSAPTKYLTPVDETKWVLKSNDCSRDMEVDTWTKFGYTVLRMNAAGDGIYFDTTLVTANGTLTIGIIMGAGESSVYQGTRYGLWSTTNLAALTDKTGQSIGYVGTPTDGAYFTFGVEGFDIYARWIFTSLR